MQHYSLQSTVHSGSAIDLVPGLVSFTTTCAGKEVCKQERTQEQDKIHENIFLLFICVIIGFNQTATKIYILVITHFNKWVFLRHAYIFTLQQ